MNETIDEIKFEKDRLEKEISDLLIKSWLNGYNYNIAGIDIISMDSFVPSGNKQFLGVKITIKI
jgi:hypothetical protein